MARATANGVHSDKAVFRNGEEFMIEGTRVPAQMTEDEVLAIRPEEIIPHRGDWFQAQGIHGYDPRKGILTVRCPVTLNPGWADEHYPQNPVMPGNLINEACGQAVGLLTYVTWNHLRNKVALLRGTNTTMRGQTIPPGNVVYVEASNLFVGRSDSFVTGKVRAYLNVIRDDTLVCDGEIKLALVDPSDVS